MTVPAGARRLAALLALCLAPAAPTPASAQTLAETGGYGAPPPGLAAALDRLVAAYPDHLAGHDGITLFWRDGTAMPVSDGRTGKSFDALLNAPDIDDMFAFPYPAGTAAPAQAAGDPGRIRFEPFFLKMYGDCRAGQSDLAAVRWIDGGTVRVTRVNDVHLRLQRVADRLAALPASLRAAIAPSSGGYNCRAIAGTDRLSVHAFGAAVDGAAPRAAYWLWDEAPRRATRAPSDFMPPEVVAIFESEGFIWGGHWHHYDTMHFEYRPELLPR